MTRETFRFEAEPAPVVREDVSLISGADRKNPLATNGGEMDWVCGGPSISLKVIG